MGNSLAFGLFVAGTGLALVWYVVFVVALFRGAGRALYSPRARHRLGAAGLIVAVAGLTFLAFRLLSTDTQMGRVGVLFFLNVPRSSPELYVMNVDGTHRRRLTHSPGGEIDPAWSPDGSQIAFSGDTASGNAIFVINARGGQPIPVTMNGLSYEPTWSPDGKQLVFKRIVMPPAHHDWSNDELYLINADGSRQQRLTRTVDAEDEPAWSPDGDTIAYVRQSEVEGWGIIEEIWLMDCDGRRQRPLTSGLVRDAIPAWSPDGKQVAFLRWEDRQAQIWVGDAKGGAPVNLSRNDQHIYAFAWGPDGRFAFIGVRGEEKTLCMMEADGSNQTSLTTLSAGYGDLSWSPDGRKLAYTQDPSLATETALALGTLLCCALLGPVAVCLSTKARGQAEVAWPTIVGRWAGIALIIWFVVALLGYPFGVILMF